MPLTVGLLIVLIFAGILCRGIHWCVLCLLGLELLFGCVLLVLVD